MRASWPFDAAPAWNPADYDVAAIMQLKQGVILVTPHSHIDLGHEEIKAQVEESTSRYEMSFVIILGGEKQKIALFAWTETGLILRCIPLRGC